MFAFSPSGAKTVKRRNHLTDEQIEQYIRDHYGLEKDSKNFESHIADCGSCRLRLLESERQELGVLETGLGSATRSPECPTEEVLQAFSMGICAPGSARQIVTHVAGCSYCAPL